MEAVETKPQLREHSPRQRTDDEDGGSQRRSKKQKTGNLDDGYRGQKFACHFYKRNPTKYCLNKSPLLTTKEQIKWRSCGGQGVLRLRHLLDHLKNHCIYDCKVCLAEFDTADSYIHHSNGDKCRSGISLQCTQREGIDPLQWKKIQDIAKQRGIDEASKWMEIWMTLFPQSRPPSSPWSSNDEMAIPSIAIEEVLETFQKLIQGEVERGALPSFDPAIHQQYEIALRRSLDIRSQESAASFPVTNSSSSITHTPASDPPTVGMVLVQARPLHGNEKTHNLSLPNSLSTRPLPSISSYVSSPPSISSSYASSLPLLSSYDSLLPSINDISTPGWSIDSIAEFYQPSDSDQADSLRGISKAIPPYFTPSDEHVLASNLLPAPSPPGLQSHSGFGKIPDPLPVFMPDGAQRQRHRPLNQERSRLRCHFNARNPTTHNGKTCTMSGWLSIHNLKGHYSFHHSVIRCNKCFQVFGKKTDKNQHQRNCTDHAPVPSLEVIDCDKTDEIEESFANFRTWRFDKEEDEAMKSWIIKHKANWKMDGPNDDVFILRELAKWYQIWRILFPGAFVPSPFQIPFTKTPRIDQLQDTFQAYMEAKIAQNQLPPADVSEQIDYYKLVFQDVANLVWQPGLNAESSSM